MNPTFAAGSDDVKRQLPRYARVNTLLTTFAELKRELRSSGHTLAPRPPRAKHGFRRTKPDKKQDGRKYRKDKHVRDLLVFCCKGKSDLSRVPAVRDGRLVIQQKASCFPGLALAPPPGAVVLDACAAPGSKTSHLAALMRNEGQLLALDRSAQRVMTMERLLRQRGITCARALHRDFNTVDSAAMPFSAVTHILLDPSCSTSGASTAPHTDDTALTELAANQFAVLKHAMKFPKCQVIVYSTCSVYDRENEHVVARALAWARNRVAKEGAQGWKLAHALPQWPRRGKECGDGDGISLTATEAACCVRSDQHKDETIGFFVAKFVAVDRSDVQTKSSTREDSDRNTSPVIDGQAASGLAGTADMALPPPRHSKKRKF